VCFQIEIGHKAKFDAGGEKMNRKGQSVLEYVIVLTAIIAAILIFAKNILGDKVQSALTNAATQMEAEASKIKF